MIVSPSCFSEVSTHTAVVAVPPFLRSSLSDQRVLIWGIDAKTAEVSQSAPAFFHWQVFIKTNTPLTASPSVKTSPPSSSTRFAIIFLVFFCKKKKKEKKEEEEEEEKHSRYVRTQCSQLGCHFDLLSLLLTSEAFEEKKKSAARTQALTHTPALCYCTESLCGSQSFECDSLGANSTRLYSGDGFRGPC